MTIWFEQLHFDKVYADYPRYHYATQYLSLIKVKITYDKIRLQAHQNHQQS